MTIVDKLDSYFLLTERGTTIGEEVRAGTASFLTLSYLLLVNPQIMSQAGISHDDAVFATAVSAACSCFIVGIFGNLPFGCAPGLGLSAYLTFGLVVSGACTLNEALTACWWSGILVIAVSLTGLAALLMKLVPQSIKYGIVVGMGLLIAMIGMVGVGIIQGDDKTLVQLGPVYTDGTLQLCLAGVLLVASLLYHDVKGAILIGITVLTLVAWTLNSTWPNSIVELPSIPSINHLEPMVIFDLSKASVLYPALGSFVLICIFDISGVMFGLATLGGIITPEGEIPGSLWAFLASGVGTLVAACCGSTPIIVCVESASGVRDGGRTGLTAVVLGLYFTASIFMAPLFSAVPDVATSPVLVMVGVMMMGEAAKIDWEDMSQALPAFLTIILMPLTYSITNGMIFGLLASAGFYFTTGQFVAHTKMMHRSLSEARTVGSDAESSDDETAGLLKNNNAKNETYATVC